MLVFPDVHQDVLKILFTPHWKHGAHLGSCSFYYRIQNTSRVYNVLRKSILKPCQCISLETKVLCCKIIRAIDFGVIIIIFVKIIGFILDIFMIAMWLVMMTGVAMGDDYFIMLRTKMMSIIVFICIFIIKIISK